MRSMMLGLIAAAMLMAASAAQAAPTCQDINGDTIRCGTLGAMPVGWTLPPDQVLDRVPDSLPQPSLQQLLCLMGLLGGLFGLIAVMPEFDGRRPGDWDRQEGDDES